MWTNVLYLSTCCRWTLVQLDFYRTRFNVKEGYWTRHLKEPCWCSSSVSIQLTTGSNKQSQTRQQPHVPVFWRTLFTSAATCHRKSQNEIQRPFVPISFSYQAKCSLETGLIT